MIKVFGGWSVALGALLACLAWVSTPNLNTVSDSEVASLYGGDLCFTRIVVHCGVNSDIEGCNWFIGYGIWAPTEGAGWKFPQVWTACSWSGSWECGMLPTGLHKCYGSSDG